MQGNIIHIYIYPFFLHFYLLLIDLSFGIFVLNLKLEKL